MSNKTKIVAILIAVILIAVGAFAYFVFNASSDFDDNGPADIKYIKMRIGDKDYKVRMAANPAAQEFAESTPFELPMSDLGANEKVYDGEDTLPTKYAKKIEKVEPGDLMLFGDKRIVLFYNSISVNDSYTRLGWVEEPGDLKETLGSDWVSPMFTKD